MLKKGAFVRIKPEYGRYAIDAEFLEVVQHE